MNFLYKLYIGDGVDDIDTIESESLRDSGTDITQLSATDLNAGPIYKANVLAEHIATGKKAIYDAIEVSLIEPEVTDFEAALEDSTIDPGDTTQVNTNLIVVDSDNEDITYASEDTDIATVDSSGEVTGVTSGVVNITAEPDLDSSWKVTMELTVADYVKVAASEPLEEEFTTA